MPVLLNPLAPAQINGGTIVNGGALNFSERPYRLNYKVKAATKIWQDSLVMLSNGGYAQGAYDAPGVSVGIADATVDNLSGAAGDKSVTVRRWGILSANKDQSEPIYFTPDQGPFSYDDVAGGMPEDNLSYYAVIAATGTSAALLTAVGRNHVTTNKVYAGHVVRVEDTSDSNFNVKLWFDADIAAIFADFQSSDGTEMVRMASAQGYYSDFTNVAGAIVEASRGIKTPLAVSGSTGITLTQLRGRYIGIAANATATLSLASPALGDAGLTVHFVRESGSGGAITLSDTTNQINGTNTDSGAYLTATYSYEILKWTGTTWIRMGHS